MILRIYNYNSRKSDRRPQARFRARSVISFRILEQPQISSPRPLFSRSAFQVRVRRLLFSVAVFRAREAVHAKRAARRYREKRHRSPFAQISAVYIFYVFHFERRKKNIIFFEFLHPKIIYIHEEREREILRAIMDRRWSIGATP